MISFSCPKCKTELEVSGKKPGSVITCPECEKRIRVPEPDEEVDDRSSRGRESRSRKAKPAPAKSRGAKGERRKGGMGKVLLIGAGAGIFLLIFAVVVVAIATSDKDKANQQANNGFPVMGPVQYRPGFTPPNPDRGDGDQGDEGNITPPANGNDTTTDDPGESTSTPPPSPAPTPGRPLTGDEIYRRVLKSTVWILVGNGPGGISSTGSGSLVDRKNRLVLTSYHVVMDVPRVAVCFPRYKGSVLVSSRNQFIREFNAKKPDLLAGTVLARDMQHDLALVQLPSVPEGVLALRPASESPTAGSPVHSVGNPGASGALWAYTPGSVKQVYPNQWVVQIEGVPYSFKSRVIETTSPTNAGDSGGPLVNGRAELVGVTHGGSLRANSISLFIDISEIRGFIERSEKQHQMTWELEAEESLAPASSTQPGEVLTLIQGLQSKEPKERSNSATQLGAAGPKAQRAVPFLVRMAHDSDPVVRLAVREALRLIGRAARDDAGELGALLADPAPEVRAGAADALALMGPDAQAAIKALLTVVQQEKEPTVRRPALIALARGGGPEHELVFPVLLAALKDPDREIRAAAAEGLKTFPATMAEVPALAELLSDPSVEVRVSAAGALGRLGPQAKAAVTKLTAALAVAPTASGAAAAEALGKIGPEARSAGSKLLEALRVEDATLAQAAASALAQLQPLAKSDQETLNKMLGDAKPTVRAMALLVLARSNQETREGSISIFADALKDTDKRVRVQAVLALAAFAPGNKEVIPRLGLALHDAESDVRKPAVEALAKYGPDARGALVHLQYAVKNRDRDKEFLTQVMGVILAIGPDAHTLARDVASVLDDTDTTKELMDQVFKVLVKMGAPSGPYLLARLAGAKDKEIRLGSANALGDLGAALKTNVNVIQGLQRASTTDPEADVRTASIKALNKVLGR